MEKVILLALDGLSWNIIEELIFNQKLKNIQKLITKGSSANLIAEGFLSSPKIFCSIFTGKKVEKHGIRDFYSNEEDLCSEQIWDILNSNGLTVGTYRPLSVWSPKKFEAYCIPNPLLLKKSTYPEKLQFIADLDIKARSEKYSFRFLFTFFWKLIKFKFPIYPLIKILRRGFFLSFKKGLEERMHLLKEIELLIHTNIYYKLLKKHDLDFTVFFDYSFDTLSHIYWICKNEKSKYYNILPKAYEIVDKFIGKVNKIAQKNNATLILCSDHGFEEIEKKNRKNFRTINVLYLLRELQFYYDVYGVYMFMSVVFRSRPNSNRPLEEFKHALESIKIEENQLFSVKTYEKKIIVRINEFFGENQDLKVNLPNGKIMNLDAIIEFNPGHTGIHSRQFGVFIIKGPKIREGMKINKFTHYDITPTILSLFGLPISDEMDGRVLTEILKK